MNYRHRFVDGEEIGLPVGKIVCVGRNYLEHIYELRSGDKLRLALGERKCFDARTWPEQTCFGRVKKGPCRYILAWAG